MKNPEKNAIAALLSELEHESKNPDPTGKTYRLGVIMQNYELTIRQMMAALSRPEIPGILSILERARIAIDAIYAASSDAGPVEGKTGAQWVASVCCEISNTAAREIDAMLEAAKASQAIPPDVIYVFHEFNMFDPSGGTMYMHASENPPEGRKSTTYIRANTRTAGDVNQLVEALREIAAYHSGMKPDYSNAAKQAEIAIAALKNAESGK